MLTDLSIGQLAQRGGVKVQTIRYYEQVGLIPPAHRTPGNHRQYKHDHVDLLKFIRHSRALGFSLDQVRELLALRQASDRTCEDVDGIAKKHLADVEQKIDQLKGLQKELQRMVRQCAGGDISNCRIIEVLSDHQECISNDH